MTAEDLRCDTCRVAGHALLWSVSHPSDGIHVPVARIHFFPAGMTLGEIASLKVSRQP
jgi:hypothetical protein